MACSACAIFSDTFSMYSRNVVRSNLACAMSLSSVNPHLFLLRSVLLAIRALRRR